MTSTPADGVVVNQPLTQMASAPTPILPQGIATAVKAHGGDAAARAIKKTVTRDKTKAQKGVRKSQLSSKYLVFYGKQKRKIFILILHSLYRYYSYAKNYTEKISTTKMIIVCDIPEVTPS